MTANLKEVKDVAKLANNYFINTYNNLYVLIYYKLIIYKIKTSTKLTINCAYNKNLILRKTYNNEYLNNYLSSFGIQFFVDLLSSMCNIKVGV